MLHLLAEGCLYVWIQLLLPSQHHRARSIAAGRVEIANCNKGRSEVRFCQQSSRSDRDLARYDQQCQHELGEQHIEWRYIYLSTSLFALQLRGLRFQECLLKDRSDQSLPDSPSGNSHRENSDGLRPEHFSSVMIEAITRHRGAFRERGAAGCPFASIEECLEVVGSY